MAQCIDAFVVLRMEKALAVAGKNAFRNCLVAMRPKAVRQDIPSTHEVTTYIHNEFVEWLIQLKSDIFVSLLNNKHDTYSTMGKEAPGKISLTADGWTADTTKTSFLGMTAHWIEVKEGKWGLRSEVVGFKHVSGDHSGWNLGCYIVGLCDHVGICNQDGSKVIDYIFFKMGS